MPTCKDCVHVDACRDFVLSLFSEGEKQEIEKKIYAPENKLLADDCEFFKDRSQIVELPYALKPKDKVWYILEELDERSLKDYKTTSGDCAVGDEPDTVVDVCATGFFINCLRDRNEDFLVPEDCDFVSWDEIGKSYFLTHEEAEQALKEKV